MINKSAIFLAVFILLILSGCPEVNDTPFSYDPDPVDDLSVLPSPSEDLFIVANVSGTIYGFYSSDPYNRATLATDASTEENFSEIRISGNLEFLLYATGNRDLKLLNVSNPENPVLETVLDSNIQSNESEFIDESKLFYTRGGSIRYYNISQGGSSSILIPQQAASRCNHWAKISPDKNRMIFKDQIASVTDEAFHSWSPVVLGDKSLVCNDIISYDGNNNPVGLYDSFFYVWKDNDTVIFKRDPGFTSKLYVRNIINGSYSTSATLQSRDTNIQFKKLLISPDRTNLLIYGSNGVYMIDLETQVLSGNIEPSEAFVSPYSTKYAAFGSGSQSFVIGTDNWMGVYNTEGFQKTNVSIEKFLGDYGILYALHCR